MQYWKRANYRRRMIKIMILISWYKDGRKKSMKILRMIRKIRWVRLNLRRSWLIEGIRRIIIGFIGLETRRNISIRISIIISTINKELKINSTLTTIWWTLALYKTYTKQPTASNHSIPKSNNFKAKNNPTKTPFNPKTNDPNKNLCNKTRNRIGGN